MKSFDSCPERSTILAASTIGSPLQKAKKKAGLDPEIPPSHGLRKFFEGCRDTVGMDHHKKLELEGHSQGVRVHHTDCNVEDLRGLYRQAYQFSDLSGEAIKEKALTHLEQRVERLTNENKELRESKEQLARSTEERLAKIETQLRKEAEET